MRETFRHQEAFNYYYSLGDDRNLSKVADMFGVSTTSAKKWSKAFGWQERIGKRDAMNARRLEERTNSSLQKKRETYIAMLDHHLLKADEDFRKGKLQCRTISDVVRLIKLELLLYGEPSGAIRITAESIGTIVNQIVFTVQKYVTDPKVIQRIQADLRQTVRELENNEP